uniref:Kunitz-type serine protease inhibitor BmKTT-2-like n=1 Tax=Crassostrea virginica TaxID=6565 RepID=A0A8B8CWZ7_CRAVI|nr:kunitz-type serine protease inhibitor BmKTT-2-like [Crassostrea virginica]
MKTLILILVIAASGLGNLNVPRFGCYYKGQHYDQGESFPAGDGCNTCTCRSYDNVVCTYRDCGYVCSLPQETGTCYGYFRRWWYNWATNRCEIFIYGGCQGNANNFRTKEACYRRCKRRH